MVRVPVTKRLRECVTCLTVASMLLLSVIPADGYATEVQCGFDKANPTIANARASLRALNYVCA